MNERNETHLVPGSVQKNVPGYDDLKRDEIKTNLIKPFLFLSAFKQPCEYLQKWRTSRRAKTENKKWF